MRNNVIIKCYNNAPGARYWNGSEFRPRTKQLSVLGDVHISVLLLAGGLQSHSKLGIFQCFSTFARPRPGKFFFHKTRAGSQQIYS